MKIGFNEATALECKGQSLMADLEACEKYGFDYIEIRFDCVKDYLKEHTLEEHADWFKNHHLKPWAYNTLIFFNQRDEAGVKEIDEETDFIIKVCEAIGMKMLITVPSFDVKDKSVTEIKEEAVERLRYLSDKGWKRNCHHQNALPRDPHRKWWQKPSIRRAVMLYKCSFSFSSVLKFFRLISGCLYQVCILSDFTLYDR